MSYKDYRNMSYKDYSNMSYKDYRNMSYEDYRNRYDYHKIAGDIIRKRIIESMIKLLPALMVISIALKFMQKRD